MSMHEEALRTQRIMGGFEYDYPVEQDHISHDLNSVYDNGGHGGNNDGHHSSNDFHKDNHYDYNQDNNNNNRNNNEHILSNETSNRVNADVFSIDGDEDDRTIDVVDDTDLEVDGFLAHVKAERQRKRRKKACFAVLVAGVILAVVALIVAVTATVKAGNNNNNNNNNNDTSNVQSSTATGEEEQEEDLVPRITEGAKRHWEDICSYESVQTERGRELCAVQCSKYDCCSAARDDYNPSCVEKYEMECAMRAGLCSFLYVNQEHLDHGKNDKTGYSYHNDGEHEEPQDKNHDAQEHDIPNPPASLREDCDKIKVVHETTRATCEMTCELASCCNDPDPGKNCEEENQSICASYAEYCDILSEDVAEIRTSLVTEACANAETDEAGYDYCVAVCEEHMCCVIPTGDDGLAVGLGPSCKDDPEKGCESYQGCEILHTIAEQKENGGGN